MFASPAQNPVETARWEYASPLVAIFGVALGWFLNEISASIKARREDRRAIGLALTELLEIRRRLLGIPIVTGEIQKRVDLPPNVEVAFRTFFGSILPDINDAQKRLAAATDLVAGRFPLLAVQLRSKGMIGPYLDRLRTMAATGQVPPAFTLGLENQMVQEISADLDGLVIALARLHGFTTWVKVKLRLKKPVVPPKQMNDALDRLLAALGIRSQGQAPPPINDSPHPG